MYTRAAASVYQTSTCSADVNCYLLAVATESALMSKTCQSVASEISRDDSLKR